MTQPSVAAWCWETHTLTTEDLLMLLCCVVDAWVRAHGIPARPGPTPSYADSAVLTFALARELLGSDSERRFRRVLLAAWRHLFPHIPAQSARNRCTRWRSGALAGRAAHDHGRLSQLRHGAAAGPAPQPRAAQGGNCYDH